MWLTGSRPSQMVSSRFSETLVFKTREGRGRGIPGVYFWSLQAHTVIKSCMCNTYVHMYVLKHGLSKPSVLQIN